MRSSTLLVHSGPYRVPSPASPFRWRNCFSNLRGRSSRDKLFPFPLVGKDLYSSSLDSDSTLDGRALFPSAPVTLPPAPWSMMRNPWSRVLGSPYRRPVIYLCFYIFFFVLKFRKLNEAASRCKFLLSEIYAASWICTCVSFAKFEVFMSLFPECPLSSTLSFWDSRDMTIGSLLRGPAGP